LRHRIATSVPASHTGFGLGLSIARTIAIAHGGELSLHDRQPHGLIVLMQLPMWQQPRLAA